MISGKTIPCRACGAPLRFIKTTKGKTMPVDAQPIPFVPDLNGKDIYVTEDGMLLHGVKPKWNERDVHQGYVSHFATCPAAERFRKPRKGDPR